MDDDRGRCTHECPVSRINPASFLAFLRDTTGPEPYSETVRRRCVLPARHRGDHEVEAPGGQPLVVDRDRHGPARRRGTMPARYTARDSTAVHPQKES